MKNDLFKVKFRSNLLLKNGYTNGLSFKIPKYVSRKKEEKNIHHCKMTGFFALLKISNIIPNWVLLS